MRFAVLGPLEAEAHGVPLRLTANRRRVVLTALLAHANDLVPLDRLIDWTWPRRAPRAAAAVIQAHVSQLRRALEPGRAPTTPPTVLVYRAPGYLLRVRPDDLDLLTFEALVPAGRAALEAGDPAQARELLSRALALWRGSPLADASHVDAAAVTIFRLEAVRRAAIDARIEADLRLGLTAELVPELQGLVRTHPFDERLCAQLMLALYRCGRQAESLAAYGRMRTDLARELHIAPTPAARRLWRSILAQDPALDAPTAALHR